MRKLSVIRAGTQGCGAQTLKSVFNEVYAVVTLSSAEPGCSPTARGTDRRTQVWWEQDKRDQGLLTAQCQQKKAKSCFHFQEVLK